MTTATAKFQVIDFNSDDFSGEIAITTSIPYAQVENPRSGAMPEANVRKNRIPFGIFINSVEAEKAGFKPSSDWEETTLTMGPNDEEFIGYLTKILRCVVLRQSPLQVERWDTAKNNYQDAGLGYIDRTPTEVGQIALDKSKVKVGGKDVQECRFYSHVLLYFVDDQQNLLSELPMTLKLRGGFSMSFSTEIKALYGQMDAALVASGKLDNGKRLFVDNYKSTASLAVVSAILDFHKGENSPYTCIKGINIPASNPDNLGQTKVIERGERKVTWMGVNFNELYIGKQTEVGQRILQAWQDFESFTKPKSSKYAAQPFKDSGRFNVEAMVFNDDGTATSEFVTSGGQAIKATLSNDVSHLLADDLEYIVTGTLQGGVLTVKTGTMAVVMTKDAVATHSDFG